MKAAHALSPADAKRVDCSRCDAKAVLCEHSKLSTGGLAFYYYCAKCWVEPGPSAPSPAERTGVAAPAMRTLRMCATKYLGPTDHRGGRVKATHLTTRKSTTVPWDHALGAHDNHALAAAVLFGRPPEVCTSVDGGGYIFGVDPSLDTVEG